MDNNVLKGKWKQLKGEAQKQWGKLTNDDLDVIDGEREKLVGKLQERYGHTKDKAEEEYNNWTRTWNQETAGRR
ncbi:CsbD family protein [Paenibacillus sp. HJGM_3]|uniref:CsbD family protein n=1 Tax=Paenibacillus sp. HJGM_3 TaxID=3379816 RepID=UPI0038595403